MQWIVGPFLLVLLALPAFAHMTVTYDGSAPIPVHVKAGSTVQINFPAPITGKGGTAAKEDVKLTEDTWHPHRLILEAIAPPQEAMFQVNTQTGAQYLLQLTTVKKKPHDFITVMDPPKPSPETAAVSTPSPDKPGGVADPVRQLWLAQWGGDPRLAPRGVSMDPVHQTLLETADQHIEVLWAYKTRGFYGFTERVTNKSATPFVLWLPGLHDPYARLWSASLDKPSPAPANGDQTHIIGPGQSVLLHLVYEEVK